MAEWLFEHVLKNTCRVLVLLIPVIGVIGGVVLILYLIKIARDLL